MANDTIHVDLGDTGDALARLAMTMGKSRQEVVRDLIRDADEKPVHRVMLEFGVNRAEARAYLGRRQ